MDLNWAIMPVNMSIKAVPDALMEKLRKELKKSPLAQGELITIWKALIGPLCFRTSPSTGFEKSR